MDSILKNVAGADECMRDEWVLPNGLRVLGERLPHLRSVSIGAWMHVGSMMETPEENGLSHFIEHMIFKGTTKRTVRQIAEEMDAVGGQLNAFTGKDCTCCYAKVIDEDIELAIDIIADMVMNATMDEKELDKERGVVLEEISMDEDSPEDLVHDLLAKAQFGTQSLGQPILGPAEQVAAYTRANLMDYKNKHYLPRETVVALAGNYEPAQVQALMEKYFGTWQGGESALVVPKQQVLIGRRVVKEKDTEQLHICLGYPGFAYGTDDVYAVAVMNNVLGGAMSSRLFQQVREQQGLCYSIYSYGAGHADTGVFCIYTALNRDTEAKALATIRQVVDQLRDQGPTHEELERAREQSKANVIMGLESTQARMSHAGRSLLFSGEILTPEAILAAYDAVTREDVMALARDLFQWDQASQSAEGHVRSAKAYRALVLEA